MNLLNTVKIGCCANAAWAPSHVAGKVARTTHSLLACLPTYQMPGPQLTPLCAYLGSAQQRGSSESEPHRGSPLLAARLLLSGLWPRGLGPHGCNCAR